MVHIYCGEGKGKTTASVGLAMRALGNGYSVVFVQFLKSGRTGEVEVLKTLDNVKILRAEKPMKFTFQMNESEREECRRLNEELFQRGVSAFTEKEKAILVLDEAIGSLNEGLLNFTGIKNLLETWGHKPEKEILLTGRGPSKELLDFGDYVSKIEKVKHPYDLGTTAREGIEF